MNDQKNSCKKSQKTRKSTKKQPLLLSLLPPLSSRKNEQIILLCKKIAKESNWNLQHIPQTPLGKGEKAIRPILNKEALSALKSNKPKLCVRLISTYFKFYSKNLLGHLIKAEANHYLNHNDEALKSLKAILTHKSNKFQRKASVLCKSIFAEKAAKLLEITPPKEAINYYFSELIKLNIIPTYNESLNDILEQINCTEELPESPDFRQLHLNLRFDAEVIHFLENKLSKKFS